MTDNNTNFDSEDNKPDPEITSEKYSFSLRRDINPQMNPLAAAFIGLFGGFILYQIAGGLLSILVFGMDLENAPVNGVRLMTMGSQILFILLPAIFLTKVFYEDVTNVIRFNIPKISEVFLFSIGIILLTPLLQYYMEIQNYFINQLALTSETVRSIKDFFDSTNELLEKTYFNLMSAGSVFEGIFVIGIMAVVPALCEEVMFRGYIQRSFEFRFKPFNAALITAIFFGIFHFNPYGVIPLIGLGLYFGFAAYTSNSIFVPMFLHFLNNLTAVLLFFILGEEELISSSAAATDMNLNTSIILFLVFLALFTAFIFFLKSYYKKRKNLKEV